MFLISVSAWSSRSSSSLNEKLMRKPLLKKHFPTRRKEISRIMNYSSGLLFMYAYSSRSHSTFWVSLLELLPTNLLCEVSDVEVPSKMQNSITSRIKCSRSSCSIESLNLMIFFVREREKVSIFVISTAMLFTEFGSHLFGALQLIQLYGFYVIFKHQPPTQSFTFVFWTSNSLKFSEKKNIFPVNIPRA